MIQCKMCRNVAYFFPISFVFQQECRAESMQNLQKSLKVCVNSFGYLFKPMTIFTTLLMSGTFFVRQMCFEIFHHQKLVLAVKVVNALRK